MKRRRTGRMDIAYVAWVLWALLGLAALIIPLLEAHILIFLASVVVWWVVLRKLQRFGGEPDDSPYL